MLEQLQVNNLAISKKASIDLTDGMICVTGETGAGKSLVVDALSFILGERADSSVIRQGEDRCEIEAIFSISNNKLVKDFLKDNSFLDADDENSLILRRIISKDNKSKAYINGKAATLSKLKELGHELVSIHGQHASIKLIDPQYQLSLLDNYASLEKEVSELNTIFIEYNKERETLVKLSNEQKNLAPLYKEQRQDYENLKKLNLTKGSYEDLEFDFDRSMHQERVNEALSLAFASLSSDEGNVIDILSQRLSDLIKVKAYDEKKIDPICNNLNKALEILESARDDLDNVIALNEVLDVRELEEKMALCHNLSRKLMCTPDKLYEKVSVLEGSINYFKSFKDRIEDKTQKVKELRALYNKKAEELSQKRKAQLDKLCSEVTQMARTLSMEDAIFKANFSYDAECKPRYDGRDNVEFLFSANLGQDVLPLGDVASGGELSRLALCIEVLTKSKKAGIDTLIFDEVDTGISGRTAQAVGALIKRLSKNVQVITVTHLPQVAAYAKTQFLVSKYNLDGEVNSKIEMLDKEGRILELARMMGGSIVTEDTRKSALQLLEQLSN